MSFKKHLVLSPTAAYLNQAGLTFLLLCTVQMVIYLLFFPSSCKFRNSSAIQTDLDFLTGEQVGKGRFIVK